MEQLQALKELAEKVEAGTISGGELTPHYAVRGLWSNYTFPIKERAYAYSAYHGSLDAAHALHKAVLHEAVELNMRWSVRYGSSLYLNHKGIHFHTLVNSENPARAWLLAIIKAKIAELE